jgi:uncharacterized protein (TIGR02687 family)
MNNISNKLNELFEKYNIIFWYDDEAKMQEEFDFLEIGATKLQINNNQFNIKYQILSSSKDSKYLIYSDKKEPNIQDNWLLDIQLKSYLFSADRTSMVLKELGIDIVYKPFVQNHSEFFNAKKRIDALKKYCEPNDDDTTLALKMIATIVKCEAKISDIVIKLLTKSKLYEEIVKYSLEKYLWDTIKTKYKYQQDTPTIKDFGYKLLQNHFFSFWDVSRCELNREAVLFIKNWMDSSSNKASFEVLSKSVQDELSISNLIGNCSIENIKECDTYELCEQMVVSNISKIIASKEFDSKEILAICSFREHTYWYSKYQNIYKALKSAVKLIDMVRKENFIIDNFDDGIKRYSNNLSKIDYYYRKYINYSNKSEHSLVLKALNEIVENIYLNDYLRVLNNSWQTHIAQYKQSSHSYQKDFYKTNVAPIVEKGQKVFVIISDALRYECAVELTNKIVGINRYNANIEPMIGVLPSFTQLGIAALLPNETLSFDSKDDAAYINNKSSKGTANRNKVLKNINEASTYINSESFLDFNRDDGREFAKAHQVVYIYHNEIDSTGDKAASEHKVFDAVDDSFVTIEKIIKQISNMNGSNIFITSDHGFLYQNTPTLESEFCTVAKPENTKRFNRRFVIGSHIEKTDCIELFESRDLNISSDDTIALAKSINKIRLQGGGHRFVHGGATLQEMVVPLIIVKKKRKDDLRDVVVSCTPLSQITTNNVMISFYQEEPVSDKVKPLSLKVGFFTKSNKLLSNTVSHTFNSIDTHDRNREIKLKFDLKQNAGNHSGETIKLVMKTILEGSNEEPLYKEYEIKLQLSFVNDFDDF